VAVIDPRRRSPTVASWRSRSLFWCGWRIHKIMGQEPSGAPEPDCSSASNTKQSLSATQVLQNCQGEVSNVTSRYTAGLPEETGTQRSRRAAVDGRGLYQTTIAQ
jgi:hypothetical protein